MSDNAIPFLSLLTFPHFFFLFDSLMLQVHQQECSFGGKKSRRGWRRKKRKSIEEVFSFPSVGMATGLVTCHPACTYREAKLSYQHRKKNNVELETLRFMKS